MNGVINIITKKAGDTPGGLVSIGTGSKETATGLVQFGGPAGRFGSYRAFAKYFDVGNAMQADGTPASDGWHGVHGGFRADLQLSERDNVTVQGDLFGSSVGQTMSTLISNQLPDLHTFSDKAEVRTGNILGRWTHSFANGSQTSLQLYYDRVHRVDQGAALDLLNTGDADFQYHFHLGSRHDVVAGGGYRLVDHVIQGARDISFGTGQKRDNLYNTFLQDQVQLTSSLALTIGSKFEHNNYTGFEYEPSAQLVWTPTDRQTVWVSGARAIRQPNWFDAESKFDVATFPLQGGGFGLVQFIGNPNTKAEAVVDFEAGYRIQMGQHLSLDTSAFRSRYTHFPTQEPLAPYFTFDPPPLHLVAPSQWDHLAQAHTYGGEFSANWDVTSRWRISPGYSFLQMRIVLDRSSLDPTTGASAGYSPKHQAQLRSTFNLPHNLEWDTSAYYVGALKIGPVPSYTRLDTRVGWRPNDTVELSIAGQNLLTPHRFEFLDGLGIQPTQVQRSVVGRVEWRF